MTLILSARSLRLNYHRDAFSEFPLPKFPPLPSREHCLVVPPATSFNFSYRIPHKVPVANIKSTIMNLWTARFNESKLRGIDFSSFKKGLLGFKDNFDGDVANEGYNSSAGQKQNTVTWTWGHHLWFGTGPDRFEVSDHMGDKWLLDMESFINNYGMSVDTFKNKTILDVGTWTGATTYMLCAMGAKHVVSVEEAKKYSAFTQYVVKSYELPVTTVPQSLYDLEVPELHAKFDIVYFPGVIYHLSDPVLALRILFNRLKLGGIIIVETMSADVVLGGGKHASIAYDRITRTGNNYFGLSARVLREMMEDVGFSDVVAIGKKTRTAPMKQAGLSRRDIC